MEKYMSKTRANYGSRIARAKIGDKDNFELKGQFLKELHDNEDANEHIEKVLEIVNLFHIPNITRAVSHWIRNKPFGLIITWEDLKTKFLSKYCPPARIVKKIEEINNFSLDVQTRQILDLKGAIPSKTAGDAKVAIQEMVEYSQKWHNGTSRTRAKRHEETNMIKEIRAFIDSAMGNQRALIKTLEIQIGKISKVLQERGFRSLPSSTEANPRDHVKSISTTAEADSNSIRHIGSPQYTVSTSQNIKYSEDIQCVGFDHDHYQEAACAYHEERIMHDCVQLDHVVDSHDEYTNDRNIIMCDQNVRDNEVPVVHSGASSVPTNAFMMIYDDMCDLMTNQSLTHLRTQ
nr:hypothetical protein [Tanacetum cinerariifolium]